MNDEPRQILRGIIRDHGREVCDDSRKCKALLSDLCPEHKREINVLVGALNERVASELLTISKSMPLELVLPRLVNRLQDNLALTEEAAQWAVESWALALGVLSTVAVCPACGNENDTAEIYCQKCTSQLQKDTTCQKCGFKHVPINAKFCPKCGKKVSGIAI